MSDEYDAWAAVVADATHMLQPSGSSVPPSNTAGQVLARSVLLGFVNTFEIYLADLMLDIYLTHPLTLKSNASVTVEEVLNFNTILEFVEFEANRRIGRLARGSIDAYVETFRRQYQLEVFTEQEQPRARELFEIRNLYTHQNGRIDLKFLTSNPAITISKGTQHQMSVDDLLSAAQFLLTIANRIDQAVIAKYQLRTITT